MASAVKLNKKETVDALLKHTGSDYSIGLNFLAFDDGQSALTHLQRLLNLLQGGLIILKFYSHSLWYIINLRAQRYEKK